MSRVTDDGLGRNVSVEEFDWVIKSLMSSILILIKFHHLHRQPHSSAVWPDGVEALVGGGESRSGLGPSPDRHPGQGRGRVVETVRPGGRLDGPAGPGLGPSSPGDRVLVTLTPGAQREVSVHSGGRPGLVDVVLKVLLRLQIFPQ